MSEQAYTPTHKVTRVSSGQPLRVFFNPIGRSLEFEPAEAGGSPQDVCAGVANAITGDESLAPHFRVEPLQADVAGAAAGRRGKRTEPAA